METRMGGGQMSQSMVNLITKDTTKEQHKEIYKNYPTTTPKGGFEAFHASTVEPIFCEVPDGSKVLDVGCNSGELMLMLKEAKGCDVTGIDLSETALKIAKEKDLDVFYADAEDIPFRNKTFDVVIVREVLSHILDPQKALKEIRRVLKPGGFLLGSTPHANLERMVWEESRLHHRYYDEKGLQSVLSNFFEKTHLRILKGGQFSMGFANSMLATEPVEMLFKSGNKKTKPWEHALVTDKKTLRVWMGPTQPAADAYYRMIGYAMKMRKMKGIEIGFDGFSWKSQDGCSSWQGKIMMDKDGRPTSLLALDQLEKCMKVADPWVFQLTYSDHVLAFFEVAKQVHPNKKFITETDDWIFDIPAYNVASNVYKPNSPQEIVAYEQFKMSDAIIVSTSFLKEKISALFPEKKIFIIPNAIDFDLWDNAKAEADEKPEGIVRIGYTGCGNHDGDIQIITPVISAILKEYENVEFIFAQDFPCLKEIAHPRLKIIKKWANIIDYPSMIKSWNLDIGIAPLRDNEFNRSKSNLRWLEYSALKIPTVMSNVRPFTESVLQSKDGLIASTRQSWYPLLKSLIEDKSLRSKIGNAAYDRIKKDFNMDIVSEQYANVLKEIRG